MDKKKEILEKAQKKYNEANDKIRESLEEAKKVAAEKIAERDGLMAESESGQTDPQYAEVSAEPEIPQSQVKPRQYRPLIYFNYPVFGHTQDPVWIAPLKDALEVSGYSSFIPTQHLQQQFNIEDLHNLSAYPQKIVKNICPMLRVREELTFPINHASVIPLIEQAESNPDVESSIFRELWFLNRASLMIADFVRECHEVAFSQRLTYAKLFDVPVLGISSGKISLDPWVQKSISVLFTEQFNIVNILPLIRGYAPTPT